MRNSVPKLILKILITYAPAAVVGCIKGNRVVFAKNRYRKWARRRERSRVDYRWLGVRWNTGEDGRENCKDTSNFVDSLHTSSMDSFIFLRGWQIQVLINTILVCHICKIWIFVFRSTLQCKMEQLKSKGCLQIFEMAKVCTNLWIRIRWICRQIGKNWKWEKIYVTLSILHRAKIQWKWYHNEESSYNYKLWIKNFIMVRWKSIFKEKSIDK